MDSILEFPGKIAFIATFQHTLSVLNRTEKIVVIASLLVEISTSVKQPRFIPAYVGNRVSLATA
jgi:hypothetical protein